MKKKYFSAWRSTYPDHIWDSVESDLAEKRFHLDLKSADEVLEYRGISKGKREKIIKHLLYFWPAGFVGYNKWYAIHKARDLGLLNEKFEPIEGKKVINEESRRLLELRSIGGPAAVAAYESLFLPHAAK